MTETIITITDRQVANLVIKELTLPTAARALREYPHYTFSGTAVVLGNEIPFDCDADTLVLRAGLYDEDLDAYVLSTYSDGTDTEVVAVPAELWEKIADEVYRRAARSFERAHEGARDAYELAMEAHKVAEEMRWIW